jgi:HEAT repeat protein
LPAGALPTGLDEATAAAWQRRGRVKQALCLAIGATRNADPEALRRLQRYATDQREDCAVRAAACKALGQLGPPGSRSTLEQAARDGEWCTATEAAKALAALDARAEI